MADGGIWSFNGNKIITTSGGGAVLCKTPQQREKVLFWATQAKDSAPWYEHSEIGHSYRLSNILAALGLSQWTVLSDRVKKRRSNYERYRLLLEPFVKSHGLRFQRELKGESNRWMSTVLLSNSNLTPDDVIKKLNSDHIEARYLWKPMHMQPLYAGYEYFGAENSQRLFQTGVCLPSGSSLGEYDWKRISKSLVELLSSDV